MAFREFLHHELGAALGLHHEDPVIQNLAGLRRIGGTVYALEDEIKARESQPAGGGAPDGALQRARCYFAAATALVTFADAFVIDAFLDPDHPKHVPHVTYLQARQFYLLIPDLVTAVRQEIAYAGSATRPLPVLCGPRIEIPGKCPLEHLLAMKRAAEKIEEVIGTRIALLQAQGGGAEDRVKPAVLKMAEAKTKRESADRVIGAIRTGQHVPQEAHEEAEAYYYDGVLRAYLYAAQDLELANATKGAPDTENEPEEEKPAAQPAAWQPRVVAGPGATGGGIGFGQLFTADLLGNLAGDLLAGMFGGGGGMLGGGGGMFGGGGGGWW